MSVKLRKKKLSGSKISLYLDIYLNGQRQYDFLNLYLYKGTSSRIKATNKDTLELAETIRANRQTRVRGTPSNPTNSSQSQRNSK